LHNINLSTPNIYREIGLLLSFVYLFGWVHTSAVSLPPVDVILTQLACLLNDVIFCLHKE
jgi:hypothetical protein